MLVSSCEHQRKNDGKCRRMGGRYQACRSSVRLALLLPLWDEVPVGRRDRSQRGGVQERQRTGFRRPRSARRTTGCATVFGRSLRSRLTIACLLCAAETNCPISMADAPELLDVAEPSHLAGTDACQHDGGTGDDWVPAGYTGQRATADRRPGVRAKLPFGRSRKVGGTSCVAGLSSRSQYVDWGTLRDNPIHELRSWCRSRGDHGGDGQGQRQNRDSVTNALRAQGLEPPFPYLRTILRSVTITGASYVGTFFRTMFPSARLLHSSGIS